MSDTNRGLYDAALESNFPLTATAGTAYSAALPVKNSPDAVTPAGLELEVYLPPLLAAELPAGASMTAVVQHSSDNGDNWSSLYGTVASQSGSTAGSDAVVKLVGLPSNCGDLVRLSCTASSGAGDASDKAAALRIKF